MCDNLFLLYFSSLFFISAPFIYMVFISQVQITCFYSVMAAVTKKSQQTLNFKDNKVEKNS